MFQVKAMLENDLEKEWSTLTNTYGMSNFTFNFVSAILTWMWKKASPAKHAAKALQQKVLP